MATSERMTASATIGPISLQQALSKEELLEQAARKRLEDTLTHARMTEEEKSDYVKALVAAEQRAEAARMEQAVAEYLVTKPAALHARISAIEKNVSQILAQLSTMNA